ncbi:hypothetical protein E2C01_062139 [Portunus trituberculatus]|uniref:Uncharacterized protein n=1 Tax=Portunus trituberculatus TaxID=210409 RepID=A0A5B7HCU1_PORTR|nr:hypothetical protein [Portunus trituberculatus]
MEDMKLEPDAVVPVRVIVARLASPPLDRLVLPRPEGRGQWRQRALTPSHLQLGERNSTPRTCLAKRFCLVVLRIELCASSLSLPLLTPPLLLSIDEVRLEPTERSCEGTGTQVGLFF